EEEELHAREEDDRHDERREAARRLVLEELREQRVAGEEEAQEHRADAEDRRGAERYDGEREDAVERQPQERACVVLGRARHALRALDGNAGLAEPDPGAEPAEIALPLGRGLHGVDDAPAEQREVAGVEWERGVGEGRDGAIEEIVARAEEATLLPRHALRIHDIVAELLLREEAMDRAGRVLTVAVHDHDEIARRVVESGAD